MAILINKFGHGTIEIIEDALQDAAVKALGKWNKEMPQRPEAWLYRVALNKTIPITT